LNSDVDNLQRQLRKNGGDLPFAAYTEARGFLNNLDDALTAVRQPNVGNHFTGKLAVKAKTVPELVDRMKKQGLQFASATPGDERAYVALHQAPRITISLLKRKLPAADEQQGRVAQNRSGRW
jgi:hypothetical protein